VAGTYKNVVSVNDPLLRRWEWLKYRHLMLHLVGSDLRSRYRRTALGLAWAVVWPVVFSAIFAIVAINLFDTTFSSYVAYVITGYVVWDFLAGSINGGTASFLQAEGYLRQTRLPHLLFPLRTVTFLGANLLLGSVAALLVVLFTAPQSFGPTWLFLPFAIGLTYLFAIPLALISAIANVKVRDYQHAVTLVVFMLWYLSPVLIAREVYEKPSLKWFTDINPFASLVDLYRDPILNHALPSLHDIIVVFVYGATLWSVGLFWLEREKRTLVFHL
jgi:lipopolysaccharide transport system permease protein